MNTIAKIVVLIVLLAGVVGVIVLKAKQRSEELTFDAAVEVASGKALPQLVDLGAGKCIPCKVMAPILEALRRDFDGVLDVAFVDVWENPTAGEVYNIRMIPTQIFFDAEGRELFRHEGFYSREEILTKWRELGFGFEEQAGTDS